MDREPEPYPKGIAVSHHTQKIDHMPQLDYRFEKALITRAVGPSVLVKDHLNLVMFFYRFGQSNCTIDSTIHKVMDEVKESSQAMSQLDDWRPGNVKIAEIIYENISFLLLQGKIIQIKLITVFYDDPGQWVGS
ncbi:hypothetical protein RUM43_003249 [Polyplax serrata]|uniref:Uncharacterized protein n=1 Tax=Polyplax serrata TaxID=468196 RepID=A0AAN8PF45_POLSC